VSPLTDTNHKRYMRQPLHQLQTRAARRGPYNAEEMAYAEDPGSYGYPFPPHKPDPPH